MHTNSFIYLHFFSMLVKKHEASNDAKAKVPTQYTEHAHAQTQICISVQSVTDVDEACHRMFI